MRIVFLLEESSMEMFLEALLGRLFPNLIFKCVVYSGARDLEQSLTKVLKSWRVPGDRFVVVRDNDGGDCYARKRRLVEKCGMAGRDDVLVRIVC